MNVTNDTAVSLNTIKKEPIDHFEASEHHDDEDRLNYRYQLIGPFAVNESTYHDEKYQPTESSRTSDPDILSVRVSSRDGAESIASPDSIHAGHSDDMTADAMYECKICCAKYRSVKAFRGHMGAHGRHDNPAAAYLSCAPFSGPFSPKQDQTSGTFTCNGCQKVFYSRDTYAFHMMMRAKNDDCSLNKSTLNQLHCDLKEEKNERVKMNIEAILSTLGHTTWNAMDMHKMSMRKAAVDYRVPQESPRQQSTSNDVLSCTVCGEVMHSKDALAMHMLFHARGASNEETQQKPLPLPQLPLSSMREYANALAIAGNKLQAARNMAAFHQAALSLTTDNIAYFDSRSTIPQTSPKQIYEPLALVKRNVIETRPRSVTSQSSLKQHDKMSPMTSPMTSPIRQPLQNGFLDSSTHTSTSDVDESKSDTALDVGMEGEENNSFGTATTTADDEQRPKSLDSGIKMKKIIDKKHNNRHKNSMRTRMLRKYFKQNNTPKRHSSQVKMAEDSGPPPLEPLVPVLEMNPKISRDLLASRSISCYCQYCEIIYLDKTIYQLHMGLHNVNNPWQCNACGKVCVNRLEFSSHVLHY